MIREDYSKDTGLELQRSIFAAIGILTLINIFYLIFTVVMGCKASRRRKFLEKKKAENMAISVARAALLSEVKKN